MSDNPTPRRVEWSGPESWTVWADEDGVHLRSARGDSLEMPDVQRLFDLWSSARAATHGGTVPAPAPPTREQVRAEGYDRVEARALRRAIKAVKAELAPSTDAPF